MVIAGDALVAGDDADTILRNQTSQTGEMSNTTGLDSFMQMWGED